MNTSKESINIYRNTRDFAEFYQKIGLDPLPIPRVNGQPAKGPTAPGWPEAAAQGHSLDDFHQSDNIGVLLGGPNHITDIDCDSPLAIEIAKEFFSSGGVPANLCVWPQVEDEIPLRLLMQGIATL